MVNPPNDKRFDMDVWIGWLLFSGVAASVGLIALGYAWRWLHTGRLQFDYVLPARNLFQFWSDDLRLALSGDWRPRLLVNLGIAILMVTPYVRVLISIFIFGFKERNVKYTLFTLLVFVGLTYSLFFLRKG